MKALDKTKNELIEEHDRLCDIHDELLEKYKKGIKCNSFFERKVSKLKIAVELKKLESRIDVLSDAIRSVDAKMLLFNEMPKAGVDTTISKNVASSETIKKSLDSMKSVIDKEYTNLDVLSTKKFLAHYFVNERRKGIKKYDLGFSSTMGGAFGMVAAILLSGVSQNMFLPFGLILLGSCVCNFINVIKVKNEIKVFNKLNLELGKDKIDLENENGMQEVYDLSSQINKKSHDIMIMETIYKEQTRNYEEALLNESRVKTEKSLNVEPTFVSTRKQYDEYGNPICTSGRWAGYADIPSDYPSKMLVECSSRTERDDTMEMGELYRHLEDDEVKLSLRR